MSTPETYAKETILQLTNAVMKQHPTVRFSLRFTPASSYGKDGRPDILVVVDGIIVEVEAKAKDNKPTPAQCAWLETTANSGGFGLTVWGDDIDDLCCYESTLNMIARKQLDDVVGCKLRKTKRGTYANLIVPESAVNSIIDRIKRREKRDARKAEIARQIKLFDKSIR